MVVRTIYNTLYGLARRKGLFGLNPPEHLQNKAAQIEGFTTAHKWEAQVGLTDLDVNVHMNNSSFFYCCELARWEWCGSSGLAGVALKKGFTFLVAGQAIRYRQSLLPFQRYVIESKVVAADDRFLFVEQIMKKVKSPTVFASVTVRATIRSKNGVVAPFQLLDELGLVQEGQTKEDFFVTPEEHPACAAFVGWDNQIKQHEPKK
uniref:Thioesterase domain-containing protein n=1 Tax=Paramoeba aestuarina TaxID=180227 RepID=A0A7S4KIZ7_9EUKA|mmetsp:Transcript_20058/g.31428  ORF Transcript_20058/g.31428 Transcript_20058/m.31428 type:complete len:205 (+) Transcript_20058:255-869(+)